jgi:diguanylate cyclase (GGDEF)-like protein
VQADRHRSLGSLHLMFRLVGGLAVLVPVVLAVLPLVAPGEVNRVFGPYGESVLLLASAAVAVAWMAAVVTGALTMFRLRRLAAAAERLADGEEEVKVPVYRAGPEARLSRAIARMSVAVDETRQAATIDRLTGVANRAALLDTLITEVERANRYDRPLSVAFVDLDHFKAVNDTYGHAAGDVVLRGVAQAIRSNLRQTDMIGRYGGEEFMLVLTETDTEDGAVLTEKLRNLVGRLSFAVEGNPTLQVTISIGIAGGQGRNLRVETLVRDADAAMYSAKSLGRNQTYIFTEPDEDARIPRAPISAAGRARAMDVGRAAREAATAALASVVAPLPHYRGQPSALIATIVVSLARHLALTPAEIDRLRIAALLHDVGKVAVPDEILEKPAALTSSEWRTVVQHPRIGQVILDQAAALKDAAPIILHPHERFAGHGYPFGLRGKEIPLGARIVAIADAYDAMIHDRPYKRAVNHDQAIAELRRHAGTQFDPELVELFCDLFARVAPVPDPGLLAISAASEPAHGHSVPLEGSPSEAELAEQEIAAGARLTVEAELALEAQRAAEARLAAVPQPPTRRRRRSRAVEGVVIDPLPGPADPPVRRRREAAAG